jgi:hypothetical protein
MSRLNKRVSPKDNRKEEGGGKLKNNFSFSLVTQGVRLKKEGMYE